MGKRIRLTDKRRAKARRAVEDSIPYPGSINQEGREFKERDKYDNWDEVIDHPLQNRSTEWKNDAHDEIGFGIPEGGDWNKNYSASLLKSASAKAVQVATLLLGENVSDKVIEAQAVDFVSLGNEVLNATIKRFADTEDEVADEDEVENAIESMEDDSEEDELEEMDYDEDDSMEMESMEDDSEEEELEEMDYDEDEEENAIESMEDEIELTSTLDDGEAEDVSKEATNSLEALFGEQADKETGVQAIAKKKSSKAKKAKKGVKKLGGQPKKASSNGKQLSLDSIWKNAPDVSETFK